MARKKGISAPITTPNKDVTTTFKFVFGRHPDISIPEQRILARILEYAGQDLQGKLMKEVIPTFNRLEWNSNVVMELHVKDFMISCEGWKHEEIENILNTLSSRSFTYEDEKIWTKATYIADPYYEKGTGIVKFRIPQLMWWAMKNFASGYREFELNKALALPTTYSFRFYMLMSGQKSPLDLPIERLFEWLGIPLEDTTTIGKDGKVKVVKAPYRDKNGKFRIDNIETKVIKPAKEVLDNTCPYTFDYIKKKENDRNPRSRVIGFRLFPIYQQKFRDPDLEKKDLLAQIPARSVLRHDIYDYLIMQMGFTKEEVSRNKETFVEAQELIPDVPYELAMINGKMRAAERPVSNPKGYIINAIKGKVADIKKQKGK